jgi:hypothetical protein
MTKERGPKKAHVPETPRCAHCRHVAECKCNCCVTLPVEWLDEERVQAILKGEIPTLIESRLLAREVSTKRLTYSPALAAFLGGLGKGVGEGLIAAGARVTVEKDVPKSVAETTPVADLSDRLYNPAVLSDEERYNVPAKRWPDFRVRLFAGANSGDVTSWKCADVPTFHLFKNAIATGRGRTTTIGRLAYSWEIIDANGRRFASGKVVA